MEGCKCDPGFILSNDKCVPLKECGCVDTSGSYHPVSKSGSWVAVIIFNRTENTDLSEQCWGRRTCFHSKIVIICMYAVLGGR